MQTYSCKVRPKKFCVPHGKILRIALIHTDTSTKSKFRLQVYAVKTNDRKYR